MKLVKPDILLSEKYGLVYERYVATPVNSNKLIEMFVKDGEQMGFEVDTFGKQPTDGGDLDMIGMYKETDSSKPYVYISSGIHGNEPAPPLAVLQLLNSGFFGDSCNWVICPVMNPYGLMHSTRRNFDGVDLNREYKHEKTPEITGHKQWLDQFVNIELTMSCHEDHDANGFYMYERHSRNISSFAPQILQHVQSVIRIDLDTEIDGEKAVNGVIHSEINRYKRKHWPELIYFSHKHTKGRHYTFETPSRFQLKTRIQAMKVAIGAAVKQITYD